MPTPSLHEVQRLFWESVAVQPGRDSIEPAFVRLVRGRSDTDRKTRIQVYLDAYYLRLRDVLREDFPRVAALIGLEQFDEIVRSYLQAFPSRWWSVRYLGQSMSDFLRHRKDSPKCLVDLADLEWARIEVFDAPDAESATVSELVSVPPDAWPALRFTAIPAIQTLRAEYPVHRLWSGDESLDVAAAKTSIRIWRANDCRVFHAPMDERESAAIQKMISGEPFASICETFADLPEKEAAQEATGLLARWIEDGIIGRIGEAV